MVQEKPPIQAWASNDCGPAVAYNMVFLSQDKLIRYESNLLPLSDSECRG